MIDRDRITGIILCGGAGSRLGGRDKPLEELGGTPLVEHVRRRLLPQVGRIVISCNRNADRYARWGDATVSDHQPGLGPLAGVLAGMHAATSNYLFVCPGDAPFMPDDLVSQLATALCRHGAEVAIPNDGARRQPLFMLIRRPLAPALRAYLDAGGRAVHGFVAQRCCVEADLALQADAFVNVNDRADMQAAAAMHHSDQRYE